MASPASSPSFRIPRTPVLAIAAAASGTIVVGSLAAWGTGEEGLVLANRFLARLAFVFFFFAFTARPLAKLWPSPTTRGLLRGRRTLGLSFAIVQLTHAVLILVLFARVPGTGELSPEVLVGGTSMLLVVAMAATSNDASVRALGIWWRRLHWSGVNLLGVLYIVTYGGRIAEAKFEYAPLLVAAVAAMGLRIYARRRRARPSGA